MTYPLPPQNFPQKAKQTQSPQSPKAAFKFPAIPWKNPVFLVILALLTIFAIKGAQVGFMIYMMKTHPPAPATVSTMIVHKESWPKNLVSVAKLESPEGAVLKAELAGPVREVLFKSGQEVKKGDLLLVINADAERAAAKLAKLNYERAKELRAQNVNTQNDLDTAEANYAEAEALLNKLEIHAPFDGKIGITQAYLGQYIKVGDPLVAIESLKKINADFGVPQNLLPKLKEGAAAELTVDAYPNEIFKGQIEGIDPRVDETTLNASARATFENNDGKLLSGMFGTLKIQLNETQEGISIPAMAVVYSAYGNAVYVLKDEKNEKTGKTEKIAQQTFVKLGQAQGDFVIVTDGLTDGDEVVVAGQIKLRNKSPVQVDNSDLPPMSKTPKPQES